MEGKLMAQPLALSPLHPTFGAECRNVDFSQPIPDETIANIRNAMAKYGFLVFRSTELDDKGHERLARQFGEADLSAVEYSRRGLRLADSKELVDVSNVGPDGMVETPQGMKAKIAKGNELFHVDCSYNPRRAGYSILRACQLPPAGTGGATQFSDTRTAYDDLDNETKDTIEDRVACHSIVHSRRLAAPEYSLLRWLRISDFPNHHHKLVQLHEPSGRKNLYIAAHVHHLEGQTEEESRPLIQQLLQHASKEQYTCTVEWQSNGDVVIWDNTCVMHRACGGSFAGRYIRDMRRATVYDDSSSARGVMIKQPWKIRWTFLIFMAVLRVGKLFSRGKK